MEKFLRLCHAKQNEEDFYKLIFKGRHFPALVVDYGTITIMKLVLVTLHNITICYSYTGYGGDRQAEETKKL